MWLNCEHRIQHLRFGLEVDINSKQNSLELSIALNKRNMWLISGHRIQNGICDLKVDIGIQNGILG